MTAPPSLDALSALDPRRELDRLRGGLLDRQSARLDSASVVAGLADTDPLALAELLVGPRADGRLVPLALGVAGALEKALSAPAVYRRLADLVATSPNARENGLMVLDHVISSHPDASWVAPLSLRIEGREAGLRHLMALEPGPSFGAACLAYARVGAREGLIEVAVAVCRPEPLAALAAVADRDALLDAAVAVARAHPDVALVTWLAAFWSPNPAPLVADVATHLDDTTAAALLALCSPL